MQSRLELRPPLFTTWDAQYVRLPAPGLAVGAPATLRVDSQPADFQYTGESMADGAEVLVKLGFPDLSTRKLEWVEDKQSATDLSRVAMRLNSDTVIGAPGQELRLGDPLAGFAGFPLESRVDCDSPLIERTLTRTNDGILFTDYSLDYLFANNRRYQLRLRCYRLEPWVEVAEIFSLGRNARLAVVFNPTGHLDHLLSHGSFEFEGDSQPTLEPLAIDRPKDVLCRLQMPPLGEYTVPNNRGWFAFFDSRQESRGMLGMMGLDGARWERPVENIMQVHVRGGRAELGASLNHGTRHWLLYAGPVEKGFTADRRFVFHRLHAEFNALRLDEHLDLSGEEVYDASCWDQPGVFGKDYRVKARENAAQLPPLQRHRAGPDPHSALRQLLEPDPKVQQELLDGLMGRFEKWVRQFQGWRDGRHDYAKNVIGFSRCLRGLMISYELLRKDGALSAEQVRRLTSYFVFAARRIADEGRWPHSKTWLYPAHPDSTRDLYTYPGEHKPDKLVWTNCLPNFQSDPLCALAHLSALIPDHPDAPRWRKFALDDLDRQLDAYCGRSGAWEESINYALYTLSYFIITFRILKNRCGIDYFQDERMRRFVGWLTRFFGPVDQRWGVPTFPAIGNAVLPCGGGEYLLCYAGELAPDDPLRHDLIAVYQKAESYCRPSEHYPVMLAAMAPVPDRVYSLPRCGSEHMDEVGVALRHDHQSPHESYLFQKIGWAKDHYEADETAFNWYAKGTPLCMEYGTYTGDAGVAAAHNLIEIPDSDSLRRGFLADSFFSPRIDYTRCELPVTLKLSHGRVRTFAEVDGPPQKPLFFYIGDENPVGPKTWTTRMLMFAKPDYLVLFDRVIGAVSHRFNLHACVDAFERDGALIRGHGRFGLDLVCFVQHPENFEMQAGELLPAPDRFGRAPDNPHRQKVFRLYNRADGVYRTVLFARERDRTVQIEKVGPVGVRVVTPEYTDLTFVSDTVVEERVGGAEFVGRVGWIRQTRDGEVQAAVIDGDEIAGFGRRLCGRGPFSYNLDGRGAIEVRGTPRPVKLTGC